MIGRLRGEIVETDGAMVVIDVAGVGYEVSVSSDVLLEIGLGQDAVLYTRQVVREDSVSLYGFLSLRQRSLFDLLMTVKGCGPKVGLALLGQVGEEGIVAAIVAQDNRSLSRATGVGPKLAERIALELREKIAELSLIHRSDRTATARLAPSDELTDALTALGYRRAEIEAVSGEAREISTDMQEQLRHALRLLKK